MLKQYVSSPLSAGSDADIAAFALPRGEPLPRDDLSEIQEDAGAMAQTVRDQLARDVADIELLRCATPSRAGAGILDQGAGQYRRQAAPLWLLIGVLWLSTALVTAGAVVAIATLAG